MKRITILFSLASLTFISTFGQWYYDSYGVTDINMLSLEQLDEALGNTKSDIGKAGAFTIAGGLIIGVGYYTLYQGLGEDPTFLEELLGSRVMGKTYIVCGAGLFVAGTIWSISDLGRIARIKSVRNRNYPLTGSLSISPVFIRNDYLRSASPGIAVIIDF